VLPAGLVIVVQRGSEGVAANVQGCFELGVDEVAADGVGFCRQRIPQHLDRVNVVIGQPVHPDQVVRALLTGGKVVS
jgi:hypothetical protein